ncbi:MAG: methylmalonyl-CoA epimerase [Candidatus Thorarchaeota archaeon]|nr:MAG: methylmalonyl-CoA epimerase [Candidatus Thorarchaeota archaeon]
MTAEKIDHIGIAVSSIEERLPYYRDILGLEYVGEEIVVEQKVRVAFLQVGESRIELLEPTSEDSPIAKFLEKRHEGIHHVSVKVKNIKSALAKHEAAGSQLIDSEPRKGAHGMLIAFVHPNSTGGVLLELSQEPDT